MCRWRDGGGVLIFGESYQPKQACVAIEEVLEE
jgi:hypothetical protein